MHTSQSCPSATACVYDIPAQSNKVVTLNVMLVEKHLMLVFVCM
jgi:hypothetical protein